MFWRLFLLFTVLLTAAIGLVGVVIVQRVEQQYLRQVKDSLRFKAFLVREVVRDRKLADVSSLSERIAALGDARITLLDADGNVLADSHGEPARMENHADRPEIQEAGRSAFGTATRHSQTLKQDLMYLAMRTEPPGQAVAYVRVALPLSGIQQQLAGLHRLVWTAAGLTTLAALVLAFWLTRRTTQPLLELTAGAEKLAAGAYGHKVYVPGRDEIGALAQTFNYMSQRLAAQFAQLEEDRQQLRAILSGMIEGVVALDGAQRILFANDRAAQLLEFPAQAVIGRKLWEVVRQRSLQKIVRRALGESEPCQEELTWNGPAAKSLTVHAARLQGASGDGAVLVLHDTSELRRLERLRQEFVANVSHELKTPLSVITACVETLLDGAVDDPEHRDSFLERIADQATRLHHLILDLLSLARIESGAEAFVFQAVPVAEAVTACLERHRARAEGKQQVLSNDGMTGRRDDGMTEGAEPSHPVIPSSRHPVIPSSALAWADEEAVGQILDNLVDNALKYTPAGGDIRVRWHTEDGQVVLEVADTGIGIPERDLPRIFERFYRVDKARSRELGGTGLGLSIVKHLVQAMHGSVSASSQPGQGTTFQVRLPRAGAD
jgi:two-component system, OmpR family, phosphate regulon sensor histidine kinase PhoR